MKKRKIAVVTGSRAEYGLLKPLLVLLNEDPTIELQLIVCCMHLVKEFGETYQLIEQDGFTITEKIDMLMANDSPLGLTKSVGVCLINFADVWQRLQPELVIILGDRFEMLAVAFSTSLARIPLAHIHGGELSYGALDEGFRHAITKLAHLHFVAADEYRKRVIQLGESPKRVHNVGAIGFDAIRQLTLYDKEQLLTKLPIQFGPLNFLVTYHPATLQPERTEEIVLQLLHALNYFEDAHIIFTHSNADEGGRLIGHLIHSFVKEKPLQRFSFISLGSLLYFSLMQHMDCVIGNSSSGIIETPYFKVPTINIGKRQDGRLKAKSIIDSCEESSSIIAAIEKSLSPSFQQSLHAIKSCYEQKETAHDILAVIKSCDFDNLLEKPFYDIENLHYC